MSIKIGYKIIFEHFPPENTKDGDSRFGSGSTFFRFSGTCSRSTFNRKAGSGYVKNEC